MMTLVPALAAGLIVAGVIGIIVGSRPAEVSVAAPTRRRQRVARLSMSTRTRNLLLIGIAAGIVVALATGWLLAIVVVPLAVAGLPVLLSGSDAALQIARLEAMEEWTRALSGVLTSGVGLEQALIATLRSTPEAIKPEVSRLVSRLRARWTTEDALRAFADELDDATGDLIAASLILGARRRGPGLATVLESLAESVASDVRARRQIEADRAKPRATARWVTIITIGVLVVLAFTGDYVAPYKTPVGQAILAVFLAAYVGVLVWMRRMSAGAPLPRFIGQRVRVEAAR
ncbi:type II secretion system F family protein [Raineyella sp.]|uniref:type II secretion system F family protein n=1 Tax=Raineyella sp. TaxID=1911550 RepID=UPI002B20C4E8|nr:type II secretion system F family protein [Raineyella sp.]MEA5052656.1 type II secretion system F family protein [Propionicimonas sp.]MEA5155642.1 type II secretion system F family protein [Raineyella sp.]